MVTVLAGASCVPFLRKLTVEFDTLAQLSLGVYETVLAVSLFVDDVVSTSQLEFIALLYFLSI